MAEPLLTTVIGSMPKPAWLYQQAPPNEPGAEHHGAGAQWAREKL